MPLPHIFRASNKVTWTDENCFKLAELVVEGNECSYTLVSELFLVGVPKKGAFFVSFYMGTGKVNPHPVIRYRVVFIFCFGKCG